MEYRIETLDEHTWLIGEGEGASGVYMYLLEGNDSAVLIDTGYGTIPLAQICGELTEKPVSVILTHGHVDHIGGAAAFDTVYLHPKDTDTYRLHAGEELRGRFIGIQEACRFTSDQLNEAKETFLPAMEGDFFDLGGRTLEILEAPGHSPGCVCILDRERRWLFTGDVCCKAHVLLHMEYSTGVREYLDSVRRLLAREGDYTITWPGHHERPVGKKMLREFEAAARGILDGSMEGRSAGMGDVGIRLLEYGDIGIVYREGL